MCRASGASKYADPISSTSCKSTIPVHVWDKSYVLILDVLVFLAVIKSDIVFIFPRGHFLTLCGSILASKSSN